MTPPRWQHCIAHYDAEVYEFVRTVLGVEGRRCLLVAGAGFDPRSALIPELFAKSFVGREDSLRALFVRERRPNPDHGLLERGDRSAAALSAAVPNSKIEDVEVISREDGAVVCGLRAVSALSAALASSTDGLTDVVLDMSALSVGVSFPIARYLLSLCEPAGPSANFHLMAATHDLVDASIISVSSDVVDPVRGFSGYIDLDESEQDPKIWLPQLARGANAPLNLIRSKLRGPVDVCPILPISERDPRAADKLIAEYESELFQEWEVGPGNVVYAIDDDPLDLYRTITAIYARHERVFKDVIPGHLVLSPSGDKVFAMGALMAALEHALPVRYVESVSYAVDWDGIERADAATSRLVHVWLSGEPYAADEKPCDEGVTQASVAEEEGA